MTHTVILKCARTIIAFLLHEGGYETARSYLVFNDVQKYWSKDDVEPYSS